MLCDNWGLALIAFAAVTGLFLFVVVAYIVAVLLHVPVAVETSRETFPVSPAGGPLPTQAPRPFSL